MDVPFPHLAEKRRWILDGYCMSVITCTFCTCFSWQKLLHQIFGCLANTKEVAQRGCTVRCRPHSTAFWEGPCRRTLFCKSFLFFNISMEKQRCDVAVKGLKKNELSPNKESIFIECMCPAVQRILSTTITVFCFADFPYTYFALLTFLGLCLHPGKSSTNKGSNLCFCEANIHARLKAGDACK